MFWFNHSTQIRALQQEIAAQSALLADLREALAAHERYIHSDAFHELLATGIFDEEKFDEIAQEAVERCVSSAELRVRF